MLGVRALLFVVAFLCFVLDALGLSGRVRLQSAGLAFWALALLVT